MTHTTPDTIQTVRIAPEHNLDVLSKMEVSRLLDRSQQGLYELFRSCSLAVLNCGSQLDDGREVLEMYRDFEVRLIQQQRGMKLELNNAPAHAFVDGRIIKGIREHLFAVVRDLIYVDDEIRRSGKFNLDSSDGITNVVFHILRNARMLRANVPPNLVVCWGGHSIGREEYDYTKQVGYELGLRGLDVCTGCGPGAMKGPMKGAMIGHAKQRIYDGRYLGITEPGIIAAESPNPIVNELAIMPDIEKRLEAFLRVGHCIVVFPGGVGTVEEILYLLGILLHPDNAEVPFPVVFTGPAGSETYWQQLHDFIGTALGFEAQKLYQIIVDNPIRVGREVFKGMERVRRFRREQSDAYYFNWMLKLDPAFQQPFDPTHENMSALTLDRDMDRHDLAANLRKAFSGIVAGNVKAEGISRIERHGPFEINGDAELLASIEDLLTSFIAAQRMRLPGTTYTPCYRLATPSGVPL